LVENNVTPLAREEKGGKIKSRGNSFHKVSITQGIGSHRETKKTFQKFHKGKQKKER